MKSIHYNNKLFTFFFIFLSFTGVAIGKDEKETPKTKLEFTAPFTKTGGRRSVDFLEDADGKKFILKYHKGTEYAIHEAIATQIGEQAGININHVEIFPSENPYFNRYGVITLHTRVPGREVYTEKSIDSKVCIIGGLDYHKNLKTLTEFIDLADIVALDIFTNNNDRHSGNFFIHQPSQRMYAFDNDFFIDQKSDPQFYAIDMDLAFWNIRILKNTVKNKTFWEKLWNRDLENELNKVLSPDLRATKAYDFLEEAEMLGKKFSIQEIKALKRVNKTLGKMLNQRTPAELYNEWVEVADKVNYTYTPGTKENIKIALEYNFHEVKRLRSKIDQLTK